MGVHPVGHAADDGVLVGLPGQLLVQPPVTRVADCGGYFMGGAVVGSDSNTSIQGRDEVSVDEGPVWLSPGV